MKAIILSAGYGSRLGNFAKELPKSLVDINGKSIIKRQIETFRNNGIKDIIVIAGPNKDKFQLKNILKQLKKISGPIMIVIKIKNSQIHSHRVSLDPPIIKNRFMKALLEKN